MGKSSIARMDPRIKDAVDELIRSERATIDDIVEAIRKLGGDASRSAVGRYVQNAQRQMENFRQSREMAKVWVAELGKEPEGDTGRLVGELLRSLAFNRVSTSADMCTDELALLARAVKDIASAEKMAAEREIRIRKEVMQQAAEAATAEAKGQGLTPETVSAIRARILGIAG